MESAAKTQNEEWKRMAALLLTGLGGEGDDNKDLFSALFCLAVLFQAKMMKNVCNSQTNCVRCYLFRTPSPFFCTK